MHISICHIYLCLFISFVFFPTGCKFQEGMNIVYMFYCWISSAWNSRLSNSLAKSMNVRNKWINLETQSISLSCISEWHLLPSIVDVQSLSSQTLCDPVNCSTPSLPVPHYLLEFAHVHVHWIGDAIQLPHFLLPSSLLPSIFPSIRFFFFFSPMSWLFASSVAEVKILGSHLTSPYFSFSIESIFMFCSFQNSS